MLHEIATGLKRQFNSQLVDELLTAYQEAKHNFYLGGLRLSAVEGGRFCEAAFRMLDQAATGKFIGLNQQLDADKLSSKLANLSRGSQPDSVRLHIPRALRVVYDIRNNRDAAHLADGIDPNLQDATLVCSIIDWVLAELVRLYHGISAAEAQKIVEGLVIRKAPAIEDFDGFLKVLKPKLQAGDFVLLVLYELGRTGATFDEIKKWVRPGMRANLRRTLNKLVDDDAFVHCENDRYLITRSGILAVEKKGLHQPQP